jgi:4-amino-4-deoxy-L-arabinose transferase-like glycosyltransferase
LVRRDFGFRIACGAALLYAIHPRIVEWSVEIVREPTFWFCTLSMLCSLRRALDGARPIWYVASILSFVAAVFVRSEGFVLIIPAIIWWGAARLRRQGWSRRAVVGLAAALLLPVVSFWMINHWSLKHAPRFARLDLLRSAAFQLWAHVHSGEGTGAAAEMSSAGPKQRLNTIYGRKLFKAFDPAIGTFAVIGLICLRRRAFRISQFGLTCMNAALLGAIYIYLDAYREINTRYFLTVALFLLPYSAAGLVMTFNFLARLVRRFAKATTAKPILVRAGCIGMAMGLLFDAMTVDRQALKAEAIVGRWIASQHGDATALSGWRVNALFPYYAHSDRFIALPPVETRLFSDAFKQANPELVVAAFARGEDRAFERYLAEHADVRYTAASEAIGLPPSDLYRIYVRQSSIIAQTDATRR